MVVSRDSMKKATATSQGRRRLLDGEGIEGRGASTVRRAGLELEGTGPVGMSNKYFTHEWKSLLERQASHREDEIISRMDED